MVVANPVMQQMQLLQKQWERKEIQIIECADELASRASKGSGAATASSRMASVRGFSRRPRTAPIREVITYQERAVREVSRWGQRVGVRPADIVPATRPPIGTSHRAAPMLTLKPASSSGSLNTPPASASASTSRNSSAASLRSSPSSKSLYPTFDPSTVPKHCLRLSSSTPLLFQYRTPPKKPPSKTAAFLQAKRAAEVRAKASHTALSNK